MALSGRLLRVGRATWSAAHDPSLAMTGVRNRPQWSVGPSLARGHPRPTAGVPRAFREGVGAELMAG